MSEIAVKTQNTLVQPLDARCIHSCVFLGDPSVPTVDLITDIPKTVLLGKSQSSIAEVKSIQLANVNNEAQPKWTEDYNADAENATAWAKLNGLSSPATPRPVQILSGVPDSKFDAIGVLIPDAPTQTNDSGESSKIGVSGIGINDVVLFADAEFTTYAGYAFYPPSSRQLYVAPNGDIYIFMCIVYGGSALPKAIYGKSTNGGVNWVWTEVDPTSFYGQGMAAMAVDKYGDIHFAWTDLKNANSNIGIKHAKLNTKTGVIGAISVISDNRTEFTEFAEYDATVHITVAAHTITVNAAHHNATAFLGRDYGADYWNGYEITYTIKVSAFSADGASACSFVLGNASEEASTMTGDCTMVKLYRLADDTLRILLGVYHDGASLTSDYCAGDYNTNYYMKVKHVAESTTMTLEIYTDSAMTSLLDTLSVTNAAVATKKRYMYPMAMWNNGQTYTSSYVVSDMRVGDGSAYSPSIQISNLGEILHIIWVERTYGTYSNIYAKNVSYAGVHGAIEAVTADGTIDKYYQYAILEVDNSGYRHIASCTYNPVDVEANVYYDYEDAGGWNASQKINKTAGESLLSEHVSNLIIDPLNNVYVAYTVGSLVGTKPELYIRKIVSGTIGSRVLVEAGDPSVGGILPYIQFDKNYDITIIYMTVAPRAYKIRNITKGLVVGDLTIIKTPGTGNALTQYYHIPTGVFPCISNVNPNILNQGIMLLYGEYATDDIVHADLKLGYAQNCILGATQLPIGSVLRSTNVRGVISRTKFNTLANTPIS